MIDTPEGIRHYLMGGPKLPGIRVIRPSSGGQQMAVVSEGTVKGGVNDREEKPIALNENRDLIVTQGLPAYVELSRLGGGYSAIATSAVAALIVRPGTTAMFTLWNGESTGGKSYVIDRLFTHNLLSTAAAAFFSLWACIHPTGMTAPGVDIARSAVNLTGNTGRTYNGLGQVGVEETVVDNGWYPWGSGQEIEPTGVLPGSTLSVEVGGRLIVPPQGGISIQVIAAVVGNLFATGCSWYEVQLDLQ